MENLPINLNEIESTEQTNVYGDFITDKEVINDYYVCNCGALVPNDDLCINCNDNKTYN